MKCVRAQTRPRFILSSKGVLGGMEFEPMLTPREKSPLPENVPKGGSNPRRCGQRAQALPAELFRPPYFHLKEVCFFLNGVRTHVNLTGKIPSTWGSEEDRTHSIASHRIASPTHYRYWLSYSTPPPPPSFLIFRIEGNRRETVEDFRPSPHKHDQSLAEYKDGVLHNLPIHGKALLNAYGIALHGANSHQWNNCMPLFFFRRHSFLNNYACHDTAMNFVYSRLISSTVCHIFFLDDYSFLNSYVCHDTAGHEFHLVCFWYATVQLRAILIFVIVQTYNK